MNDILSQVLKSAQSVLYWRLGIWKFVNGVIKVGIASYIGATATSHWSQMTSDQKTLVILTAVMSMMTFTDGFIDQTMSTLRAGKINVDSSSSSTTTPSVSGN